MGVRAWASWTNVSDRRREAWSEQRVEEVQEIKEICPSFEVEHWWRWRVEEEEVRGRETVDRPCMGPVLCVWGWLRWGSGLFSAS